MKNKGKIEIKGNRWSMSNQRENEKVGKGT